MPDASVADAAKTANGAGSASTPVNGARFPAVCTGTGPNGSPVWRPARVAVVIPTNRPDEYAKWREAWAPYLEGVTLYCVRDDRETWDEIDRVLGNAAWIIPRRTDCIRSYGYLGAFREQHDFIITLDDDCYPQGDGIREHVRALTDRVEPRGWGRTLPELMTRGLPRTRTVALNHGLWTGIPDVSGRDQMAGNTYSVPYPREQILTPFRHYPISGMNLAWPQWMTPAMYFGLMGDQWGVHRYGDIWCGLFAKRIADRLGYAVRSGTPFVHHIRASDPVKNEHQERMGELRTPELADMIDDAGLPRLPMGAVQMQVASLAREYADVLASNQDSYWRAYARAWHHWIDLTT